jgi:hypothetical protein
MMDEEGRLYLEAANKGLKEWKRRTENAEATATRRLGLLRRVEYVVNIDEEGNEMGVFCPLCGYKKGNGHWIDCELAAELGDE